MPVSRLRRSLAALTPTVLVSGGMAVAGLVLIRRFLDPEVLARARDAIGNHLQTLGTIYAVLLAFVVFVVWQQFNDARLQVEREANDVVDLFRTASGLPIADARLLQDRLRRYVDVVLGTEWAAMACGDEAGMNAGAQLLDEAWEQLHPFEPTLECHKALFAEVLSGFNDLSDARSMRLSSARMRIPWALRLLLYIGAVMVTGTVYLMWVEPFALHATITAMLAGALSHVLYIVEDLDDCFAGDYRVPREAFERARRLMRA